MKDKLKIVIAIIVIITLSLAGLWIYFISIKRPSNRSPLTGIEIQTTLKNEEKSEVQLSEKTTSPRTAEELQALKIEVSKAIADLKTMQKNESKEGFSPILLTLNVLEGKLYRGGNIANDIIKLKAFSGKFPQVTALIKDFEDIKFITSSSDLKEEFESVIKLAKAELVKRENGKFAKCIAFISRYLTILKTSNPNDELLIKANESLKEDNFTNALERLKELQITNKEFIQFMEKLESSAKLQKGIENIYFLISENLSGNEFKIAK